MTKQASMIFKPGDLLIRVIGEHGNHKLGQSYELESIATAIDGEFHNLKFKGDNKYTYVSIKYELHPISRSPLFEALK